MNKFIYSRPTWQPTGKTVDLDQQMAKLPIVGSLAYVDTIHVLVAHYQSGTTINWLRALCGNKIWPVTRKGPNRAPHNPRFAHRFAIQQPTRKTLLALQGMALVGTIKMARCDLPTDLLYSRPKDALDVGELLNRHIRQKWRGGRRTGSAGNCFYYSTVKSTARNICVYSDRPSKPNGMPCAHVEMRFMTASACRRAGIDFGALFNGIDVMALLKRQTMLCVIDSRRLKWCLEKMACKAISETRKNEGISVPEYFGAVNRIACRATQDEYATPESIEAIRAQDLYDAFPSLRSCLRTIPWNAVIPNPRWHHW